MDSDTFGFTPPTKSFRSQLSRFYIIQAISTGDEEENVVFTRWGRTGSTGSSMLAGPFSEEEAVDEFEKKFKDKTGVTYDARETAKPKKGKYEFVSGPQFHSPQNPTSLDFILGERQLWSIRLFIGWFDSNLFRNVAQFDLHHS